MSTNMQGATLIQRGCHALLMSRSRKLAQAAEVAGILTDHGIELLRRSVDLQLAAERIEMTVMARDGRLQRALGLNHSNERVGQCQ